MEYGKYEKINARKEPRATIVLLTLILFVLAGQLGLTSYLAYEGYKVVESTNLESVKQVPVNEIAEYVTTSFHSMKEQDRITPVKETLQNVHEASKKVKEMVYEQEETSHNLKEFMKEAVEHKKLFQTTLELALALQEPLKGVTNVVKPQNQVDISTILHKLATSLSHLDDDELNTFMLKATTLATDMDTAIKRFETTVDRLHNI